VETNKVNRASTEGFLALGYKVWDAAAVGCDEGLLLAEILDGGLACAIASS